jgi:hypothetical protein
MLSTHSIFEEIRANNEAFRLGGRKSERIAELTRDPTLAAA